MLNNIHPIGFVFRSAISAICWLVLIQTSVCAQPDNFATAAEAASKALLPTIEVSYSNKSAWNEYVKRVDETTWVTKRKNSRFVGDLNTAFEGIPTGLSADSSYSSFSDARRAYFERVKYVSDERETYLVFREYLTETQVTKYFEFLRQAYDAGGWRIYERSITPNRVVLEIVWIIPSGFSAVTNFEAKVTGGRVEGVKDGSVFPEGYELVSGSHSVAIIRKADEDITVTLNAAGRSASYTVPSDSAVELSAASPVGTIVASMLPPHRYKDVTADKSNWLPNRSKWAPADGREVLGSRYAGIISSRVPDLRGTFLRGLNTFDMGIARSDGKEDPDGGGRQAGDFQTYAIQKHQHGFTYKRARTNASNGGGANHEVSDGERDTSDLTKEAGGNETRPSNIAVYYYIRIN